MLGALEWWHLLSLDAPTVAGLWAWTFARAAGISLPFYAPLLLASGTWLLYVSDRILDGLRAPSAENLRPRHHFYARHRGEFLAAAVLVGGVVLWLIVDKMPARVRREDTLLFTLAMGYFLLIHSPGKRPEDSLRRPTSPQRRLVTRERWFPKELAVGFLFAAATAVPAWSRTPPHAALVPLVLLFAAICWLNCVAIESWERLPVTALCAEPMASSAPAGPHVTTQFVGAHLRTASLVLAALGFFVGIAGSFVADQNHGVAWTCACFAAAFSALLFALLDVLRRWLQPIHLRIAADAALLTPLLFLPFVR